MTELQAALSLADVVLNRPNADPDDDLALLSRQLLRQVERADRLADDLADAWGQRDEAKGECDRLRQLVQGMVDRIAAQAELLSRRAEKEGPS